MANSDDTGRRIENALLKTGHQALTWFISVVVVPLAFLWARDLAQEFKAMREAVQQLQVGVAQFSSGSVEHERGQDRRLDSLELRLDQVDRQPSRPKP